MKQFISFILFVAVACSCLTLAACSDNGKVKLIDIDLTQEEYAFAVSKTNSDLLNTVNNWVRTFKNDGTIIMFNSEWERLSGYF